MTFSDVLFLWMISLAFGIPANAQSLNGFGLPQGSMNQARDKIRRPDKHPTHANPRQPSTQVSSKDGIPAFMKDRGYFWGMTASALYSMDPATWEWNAVSRDLTRQVTSSEYTLKESAAFRSNTEAFAPESKWFIKVTHKPEGDDRLMSIGLGFGFASINFLDAKQKCEEQSTKFTSDLIDAGAVMSPGPGDTTRSHPASGDELVLTLTSESFDSSQFRGSMTLVETENTDPSKISLCTLTVSVSQKRS